MNSAVLFGIYTARFPYLDSGSDKIRPVIVISRPHGPHNAVAVVPISSKMTRTPVDVMLNDWQEAGLMKPSIARVHRLTTMLQSDLASQLGVLGLVDIHALKRSLRNLLQL
ncbi:MAG: type II toxin-antitoxin system PemK/MazF family toxin [Candidatus Saccharimonadales bacterium]